MSTFKPAAKRRGRKPKLGPVRPLETETSAAGSLQKVSVTPVHTYDPPVPTLKEAKCRCIRTRRWQMLGILRQRRDFCDVILISSDQVMFYAHSLVLGACSSFLCSSLNQMKTKPAVAEPVSVYLGDLDADTLGAILDFIYGSPPHVREKKQKVLRGAMALQLNKAFWPPYSEDILLDKPKQYLDSYDQLIEGPGQLKTITTTQYKTVDVLPVNRSTTLTSTVGAGIGSLANAPGPPQQHTITAGSGAGLQIIKTVTPTIPGSEKLMKLLIDNTNNVAQTSLSSSEVLARGDVTSTVLSLTGEGDDDTGTIDPVTGLMSSTPVVQFSSHVDGDLMGDQQTDEDEGGGDDEGDACEHATMVMTEEITDDRDGVLQAIVVSEGVDAGGVTNIAPDASQQQEQAEQTQMVQLDILDPQQHHTIDTAQLTLQEDSELGAGGVAVASVDDTTIVTTTSGGVAGAGGAGDEDGGSDIVDTKPSVEQLQALMMTDQQLNQDEVVSAIVQQQSDVLVGGDNASATAVQQVDVTDHVLQDAADSAATVDITEGKNGLLGSTGSVTIHLPPQTTTTPAPMQDDIGSGNLATSTSGADGGAGTSGIMLMSEGSEIIVSSDQAASLLTGVTDQQTQQQTFTFTTVADPTSDGNTTATTTAATPQTATAQINGQTVQIQGTLSLSDESGHYLLIPMETEDGEIQNALVPAEAAQSLLDQNTASALFTAGTGGGGTATANTQQVMDVSQPQASAVSVGDGEPSEGDISSHMTVAAPIMIKQEDSTTAGSIQHTAVSTGQPGATAATNTNTTTVITAFVCPVCGMTFQRRAALMSHGKIHPDFQNHKCTICSKTFTRLDFVKRHVRSHFGFPHECQECHKSFKEVEELNAHHVKIHMKQRKVHQCNICSKILKNAFNLKEHMRVHTGDKPFLCDVCPMKFARSVDLRNHQFVHKEDMRYFCHICGKRFRRPEGRRIHLRNHMGVKPYKCTICEKGFAGRSSYNIHMKNHHRITPTTAADKRMYLTTSDETVLQTTVLQNAAEFSQALQ